jgi:hypothetical protein
LTGEGLVTSLTKGRRLSAELIQDAEEAIAVGQTLWQPRAVYDWFDVRGIEGETLHLAARDGTGREATLHIGPKADLLAAAERVLASVSTIGPALEQRVHELGAAREGMKSYMLDTVGVLAVGAVGTAIRHMAEESAAQLGWGLSPSLAPGSLVGWSVRGQRELCSLLPLDSISVQLNSQCVLMPQKSASGLIGLGPGYGSTHVGSVCKYCAISDTCWRRREDHS